MTQKTHITFGIALAISVNAIADITNVSELFIDQIKIHTSLGSDSSKSLIQSTSIFLYIWSGLSALIPDLDHAKAALGKEYGFRFFGRVIRFLVSNQHRGPTHTIEFCVLYAIIVTCITAVLTWNWIWTIFYISFLGSFSHVLIDMFNNRGVRLTIFNKRKYISLIPGNMSIYIRIILSLMYGTALYMALTALKVTDLFTYLNIDFPLLNGSNLIFSIIFSILLFYYK
ncbi:MAG: metal-dependent hydrolase, partial [Spirochaetota bacterium]|nr:metal-dependent hydrolase [Spirochaetota bacterium]